MERLELKVQTRETGKGISGKLRREGFVPAVLYGSKNKPINIAVEIREVDKAVETEAGWNILLDLDIDGKNKVLSRIIDYQANPISREFTHIDFQILDLKKKIKTEVPVRMIGKSLGVQEGGILEQLRRVLEIKCLPTEIPEHIDVDISALNIGDNIHIEDITLPEGAERVDDVNFAILSVVSPTLIVEPEAAAEGEVLEGAEGGAPAEGAEAAAEGDKKEAAPKEEKAKEKK